MNEKHIHYKVMERLDEAKIHYRVDRYWPETIMILVTVPGRRYAIEVFDDGQITVAYFTDKKDFVGDAGVVDELICSY